MAGFGTSPGLFAMKSARIIVVHVLVFFISLVHGVDPSVNLTYSQYVGNPLGNGVTQWLGIRYAAAPVGNLRFEPPQDPPYVDDPQPANKHGKICLETGDAPNASMTSEDCLFLDVYAPTDATIQSNLPVFVFIQGGGFNSNAEPNLNGTGLIIASGRNIIVVTFNYRVGPYGFLSDGSNGSITANNGLRDQRKVLEWVQKYIALFGGNPRHVVLGGASAGAASVSLQMVAYRGKDYGLFHGAAASAVSFATVLTADESVYQYENLAIRLGCASNTPNQTISCLRGKSVAEIQAQNYNIPFPGAASPPLFMWGPVIDGHLLTELTYPAFEKGNFVRIPMIVGDDTNGGTIFAPKNTSSLAMSNQFIKNQFPYITLAQLARLNELYPNPESVDRAAFANASGTWKRKGGKEDNQNMIWGSWWHQLSNVYGEMRYMCPGLFLNSVLRKYGVNVSYAYRWNVQDKAKMDAGLGVTHTSEVAAIFGGPYEASSGNNPLSGLLEDVSVSGDHSGSKEGSLLVKSNLLDGPNPAAVAVIQGYWTSFIRGLDPNMWTCSDGGGDDGCHGATPDEWVAWTGNLKEDERMGQRLVFETEGLTRMEEIDDGLRERCGYLWSIGEGLRQ
ncbi:Alpha/Beta hydrolase fold [Naviculisporaceae sp. PSN 640]